MAYAWQSVEEAAVTLGISARTLHRRIGKGEVETRLASGRREVLVCLPDEVAVEVEEEVTPEVSVVMSNEEMNAGLRSRMSAGAAGGGGRTSGRGVGGGSATDTEVADEVEQVVAEPSPTQVLSDQKTIMVAQQEIALANERVRRTELALQAFQHSTEVLEREACRSRVSARLAWAAVGLLSVGVYVAVGWTASKLTRSNADNEHLNGKLETVSSAYQEKASEADRLRDELARSQRASARTEGELEALKAAATKKPQTRPSGLWEMFSRIAGVSNDE